jgi:hypothetical protein
MAADEKTDLTRILVALYKGVVYRDTDEAQWSRLLSLQAPVSAHVGALGLELGIDEAEGYAFLKTKLCPGEEVPRLVARRPLTYTVSLLLALLRKKMAEADAGGGETRLILTRDEAVDLVRVFLPEGTNEAKITDQVVTALGKVEDLGFVRRLAGQQDAFEVRRILKAFVDAQWLADFDQRLEAYRTRGEDQGER